MKKKKLTPEQKKQAIRALELLTEEGDCLIELNGVQVEAGSLLECLNSLAACKTARPAENS